MTFPPIVRISLVAAALFAFAPPAALAQDRAATDAPLTPDRWTLVGEGLQFGDHQGRRSLALGKGFALLEGVDLREGTIEFDMLASDTSNFMGLIFHAQSKDAFEVVFFRFVASGTSDAVQYQPVLNGGGTWQIFHGPGANARADLPRQRWIHVKVDIGAAGASVYLGGLPEPLLVIPNLALDYAGGGIGVWTGSFGLGAYFSNLRYTVRPPSRTAAAAAPVLAPGTIVDWELSEAVDAASLEPGVLPNLDALKWDRVRAQPWKPYDGKPLGLVLISRFRRSPDVNAPKDPVETMRGRAPGAKVVFARARIDAEQDGHVRMHFGYSDGVVVFAGRQPLFFGMNPTPFRDLGGVMEHIGEAVYLPLRKGPNEVVLAVTEFFGGWGFWARLDR